MKRLASFVLTSVALFMGAACSTGDETALDASALDAADPSTRAPDAAGDAARILAVGDAGWAALDPGQLVGDPLGGTRLKVKWVQTADGVRVPRGFHDTILGTECRFRQLGASWRCVPATASREDVVYGDAACAEPVVVRPAAGAEACPAAAFVMVSREEVCPDDPDVYQVGAARPAVRLYGRDRLGACRPQATAPPTGSSIAALTLLPRDALVSATMKPGAAQGGIAPVLLEAEDGARGFLHFRNEATQEGCEMMIAADGVERCVPITNAFLSATSFSDDMCTRPAALALKGGCKRVAYAVEFQDKVCPPRTAIRRGGDRVPVMFGTNATGTCEPRPSAAIDAFRTGDEVPAASMPVAGPPTLVDGGGRLLSVVWARGPIAVRTGRVVDRQREEPCVPRLAADGVLRCLPEAGGRMGDYFSDDGCTRSLYESPGACTARYAGRTSACGAQTAIFRAGPPYKGPTFLRSGAGRCSPTTTTRPLFEPGAEIPATEFAALTEAP